MRLYAKRLIRDKINATVRKKEETRDAILWDVLEDSRLCRVKIQGSDTLVYAHYPDNYSSIPAWLKTGNSVRVQHVRGSRNRFEVVGPGQTIPTVMPGGSAPSPPTQADCVLSGLKINSYETDPIMAVHVADGTFIINGTVFNSQSSIYMDAASLLEMSALNMMTMGQQVIVIPAAPSTNLVRYDMLVIGANGVIDLVSGTAVNKYTTIPTLPIVPTDHVRIGWIIVTDTTTGIKAWQINKIWELPIVTAIKIDQTTPYTMTWTTTSLDIDIEVYDQYDELFSANHIINLSFDTGNGSFSGTEALTTYTLNFTNSEETFTYYRDGLVTDESPMIRAVHDDNNAIIALVQVMLEDSAGDYM